MEQQRQARAANQRSRTRERLSEVFAQARERPMTFDDNSKFILFSDCHRGDNSWIDDFAHNSLLFFHALTWYYENGYTYIEVGDGDELWENKDFSDIRREHDHVFSAMAKFHREGRLYLIWGNHDIVRQDPQVVHDQLHSYVDSRDRQTKVLFGEIEVREAIVLKHRVSGLELFLVHGHQGSNVNDRNWRIGQFTVRHFWRHLQLFGVNDPTRPSGSVREQHAVEDNITAWICEQRQILICGHTHRPAFPRPGEAPYFNTGSCVHPRAITGIEIAGGEIALIKWWLTPQSGGVVTAKRELLVGPSPVASFQEGDWRDCGRIPPP
jgi:UDP-2,3-diacylglucosamine pyrophosphatase LpxH